MSQCPMQWRVHYLLPVRDCTLLVPPLCDANANRGWRKHRVSLLARCCFFRFFFVFVVVVFHEVIMMGTCAKMFFFFSSFLFFLFLCFASILLLLMILFDYLLAIHALNAHVSSHANYPELVKLFFLSS